MEKQDEEYQLLTRQLIHDMVDSMFGCFYTTDTIVICDIDGSVANCQARLHCIKDKPKSWHDFFRRVGEDTPIEENIKSVQKLSEEHRIWMVTGRPVYETTKTGRIPVGGLTAAWLQANNIPWNRIFMRSAEDTRPDDIVKKEIWVQQILPNLQDKSQIVTVIEDRPRVIRMWKAEGLHVTDVGDGVEF